MTSSLWIAVSALICSVAGFLLLPDRFPDSYGEAWASLVFAGAALALGAWAAVLLRRSQAPRGVRTATFALLVGAMIFATCYGTFLALGIRHVNS